MKKISVVICTRNRSDLIGKAVASVLANDHPDFDVIVVDQSTDDSTERALAGQLSDPRLRYVHVDRAGLSAAYNLGIRSTEGPIIAFTDDDCIAPRGWLQAIESAFDRNQDVDLLYGQTLAAPEMKDEPGVIPELPFADEQKLGRGYSFRIFGMGADFAMRRRLFHQVGGFDEALGGGGPLKSSQDFDFQYRAFKAGALTLLCPDVWVDHYGIREGKAWNDTLSAYGAGDGAFYLKHVRCGDLLATRLLAGIVLRNLARQILNPVRRRPSSWPYLRACFAGMRNSLRFKIDKDKRLYKLMETVTA
jgi:glycosyltransferase involved in cell wall biosynthesis